MSLQPQRWHRYHDQLPALAIDVLVTRSLVLGSAAHHVVAGSSSNKERANVVDVTRIEKFIARPLSTDVFSELPSGPMNTSEQFAHVLPGVAQHGTASDALPAVDVRSESAAAAGPGPAAHVHGEAGVAHDGLVGHRWQSGACTCSRRRAIIRTVRAAHRSAAGNRSAGQAAAAVTCPSCALSGQRGAERRESACAGRLGSAARPIFLAPQSPHSRAAP